MTQLGHDWLDSINFPRLQELAFVSVELDPHHWVGKSLL